MVQGLEYCAAEIKGAYLRAIVSSFALTYMHLIDIIFMACGDTILKWLRIGEQNHDGLSKDEALQMTATIMRIQKNTSWFQPENEGWKMQLLSFADKCILNLTCLQGTGGYCGPSPVMEILQW